MLPFGAALRVNRLPLITHVVSHMEFKTATRRSGMIICLIVACLCLPTPSHGSVPLSSDTGRVALHQQLLELSGRFRVLYVALRPGCEDFASLAYLHFGRGAQVTSAYVTNGESGENDLEFEYPSAVASTRRHEADEAIALLDGETHYLNMPDFGTVATANEVLNLWKRDTLRTRLMRLVASVKPDLIMLGDDPFFHDDVLLGTLQSEILEVMKTLSDKSRKGGPYDWWQVGRFLVAASTGKLVVPVATRQPLLKKTFNQIGAEIARTYRSLEVQRRFWRAKATSYAVASPRREGHLKRIDDGFPGPATRRLRWLATSISRLATEEQKISRSPRSYLKTVASLLDSTDGLLLRQRNLSNSEQRDLINWRGGLESLRVLLLGIRVTYSLSEHILTERQLDFFTVDSISGLPAGGKTEIYFPAVDRGWILNEAALNKLPLTIHEQYRLVSPERVDYDLPFSSYGMNKSSNGTTLYVFIIHHATKREESFVYRMTPRIQFAPRFEIEVLTPVVRVVQGEQVVVRVKNHSRDGVADSLVVRDSLGWCHPVPFRLDSKESSSTVQLSMNWRKEIPDGTFLVPVGVGNTPLAAFAARKFDVKLDASSRVAVVSQSRNSPMVDALRRLGVQHVEVTPTSEAGSRLHGFKTVIVDRRALSFVRDTSKFFRSIYSFAENGGRVICLSQDPAAWNASGFAGLLTLKEGGSLPPDAPVVFDTLDNMAPNALNSADLSGWIFRRSYDRITPTSQADVRVLVRAQVDNSPLVVSVPQGKGHLVYVNLCLIPQLVNINPGAFKVLADLVSGESSTE